MAGVDSRVSSTDADVGYASPDAVAIASVHQIKPVVRFRLGIHPRAQRGRVLVVDAAALVGRPGFTCAAALSCSAATRTASPKRDASS